MIVRLNLSVVKQKQKTERRTMAVAKDGPSQMKMIRQYLVQSNHKE